MVGAAESEVVGLSSACVGLCDAASVGESVGGVDGADVGGVIGDMDEFVREVEDWCDGECVGVCDGCSVGGRVDCVGLCVGAGVGTAVKGNGSAAGQWPLVQSKAEARLTSMAPQFSQLVPRVHSKWHLPVSHAM